MADFDVHLDGLKDYIDNADEELQGQIDALGGVVQRTGAGIAFDRPAVYNTPTAPSDATVTVDLTGAVEGTEVVAFFDHLSEPMWPSGVTAVGAWNNAALNVVRFLYQDEDNISAVIVSDAPNGVVVPTMVIKPSIETRSNTATVAPDADLLIPVQPGDTVIGRMVVHASQSAAGGWKYSVSIPAGATSFRLTRIHASSGAGTPPVNGANTTSGTEYSFTASAAASHSLVVEFTLINGATAGNIQLNWAQSTATNASGTSVVAGSYIEYRKYPA